MANGKLRRGTCDGWGVALLGNAAISDFQPSTYCVVCTFHSIELLLCILHRIYIGDRRRDSFRWIWEDSVSHQVPAVYRVRK